MNDFSILVVEDEKDELDPLVENFKQHGHQVVGLADPRKVASTVRHAKFDVVLVDIVMPGYHGANVVADVMTYLPTTKLIVMSGFREVQPIIECIRLGAVDFIAKPFTFSELVERIEVNRLKPSFRQHPGYLREHLIEALWENLEHDSGPRRGRRLEQLLFHVFSTISFFCDIYSNVRTDVEEIDLEFENLGQEQFWRDLGSVICVECKNWAIGGKSAGIQEFDHFNAVVRRKVICRTGLFVSMSGFSAEFIHASHRRNTGDGFVVPIDGNDMAILVKAGDRANELKKLIRRAAR